MSPQLARAQIGEVQIADDIFFVMVFPAKSIRFTPFLRRYNRPLVGPALQGNVVPISEALQRYLDLGREGSYVRCEAFKVFMLPFIVSKRRQRIASIPISKCILASAPQIGQGLERAVRLRCCHTWRIVIWQIRQYGTEKQQRQYGRKG